MLPEEIDRALKAMGDDGKRVRGAIERSFADYLEESRPKREARDLRGTVSELGGNILRPVTAEAGKRLAKELFNPESGSFAASMERIRARREARKAGVGEAVSEAAGAEGDAEVSGSAKSRWQRRPARRNVLRPG
jgi:hypothetical protein